MATKRTDFNLILVIDCETSGLFMNSTDPSQNHKTGEYYQPVSWGVMVVNAKTMEVLEEAYVEIKWDGKSLWNSQAEGVHGLSKEYLEQHGRTEEEAVEELANIILDYWGPTGNVICGGHNVGTFDVPFMRAMFERHELPIRFAHRHVDTFAAGYVMLDATDSNELFALTSGDRTEVHNALDDARMAYTAIKTMKQIGQSLTD